MLIDSSFTACPNLPCCHYVLVLYANWQQLHCLPPTSHVAITYWYCMLIDSSRPNLLFLAYHSSEDSFHDNSQKLTFWVLLIKLELKMLNTNTVCLCMYIFGLFYTDVHWRMGGIVRHWPMYTGGWEKLCDTDLCTLEDAMNCVTLTYVHWRTGGIVWHWPMYTGGQEELCLVLYTGTRLYHNTGLVPSISEPVFPLLSSRYSFRYIFSPKYFKMHEVYVFCGQQGRKLERQQLFCFELDVSTLLRRHEIVTAHENSREFHLGRHGGRHSCRDLSNKTMFLL